MLLYRNEKCPVIFDGTFNNFLIILEWIEHNIGLWCGYGHPMVNVSLLLCTPHFTKISISTLNDLLEVSGIMFCRIWISKVLVYLSWLYTIEPREWGKEFFQRFWGELARSLARSAMDSIPLGHLPGGAFAHWRIPQCRSDPEETARQPTSTLIIRLTFYLPTDTEQSLYLFPTHNENVLIENQLALKHNINKSLLLHYTYYYFPQSYRFHFMMKNNLMNLRYNYYYGCLIPLTWYR